MKPWSVALAVMMTLALPEARAERPSGWYAADHMVRNGKRQGVDSTGKGTSLWTRLLLRFDGDRLRGLVQTLMASPVGPIGCEASVEITPQWSKNGYEVLTTATGSGKVTTLNGERAPRTDHCEATLSKARLVIELKKDGTLILHSADPKDAFDIYLVPADPDPHWTDHLPMNSK